MNLQKITPGITGQQAADIILSNALMTANYRVPLLSDAGAILDIQIFGTTGQLYIKTLHKKPLRDANRLYIVDDTGAIVCSFYENTVDKTGTETITLGAIGGSGITGKAIVDWSLLTTGFDYTAISDMPCLPYKCSRDTLNRLRSNLDANDKRITNLPIATSGTEPLIVNDVESIAAGINLFDGIAIVGKEVYSDGHLASEANSAITNYIRLKADQTQLSISGLTMYTVGYTRNCRFYTAAKVPINPGLNIPINRTDAILAIPPGASYFVMSLWQRKTSDESISLSTIQIQYGPKTAYQPYVPGLYSVHGYPVFNSAPPSWSALIIGDSITETATITYIDTTNPASLTYNPTFRPNWPKFVLNDFMEVRNYAKSGASYTDRIGSEYRQRAYFQLAEAKADILNPNGVFPTEGAFSANVVFVALGTNDPIPTDSFASAMAKTVYIDDTTTVDIAATLANLDRSKFYEAVRYTYLAIQNDYPEAIYFACLPIQRQTKPNDSAKLNAIREMAAYYGFIIINNRDESGINADFEISNAAGRDLYDGLHPNDNGQRKMARRIRAAYKPFLL